MRTELLAPQEDRRARRLMRVTPCERTIWIMRGRN